MSTAAKGRTSAKWLTLAFAFTVLVPSLWGFGSKFVEFVYVLAHDSTGAFAIAPILNYLLASAGFLLLLGWATRNGMFRELETPKFTVLEHEQWLDGYEHNPQNAAAIELPVASGVPARRSAEQ